MLYCRYALYMQCSAYRRRQWFHPLWSTSADNMTLHHKNRTNITISNNRLFQLTGLYITEITIPRIVMFLNWRSQWFRLSYSPVASLSPKGLQSRTASDNDRKQRGRKTNVTLRRKASIKITRHDPNSDCALRSVRDLCLSLMWSCGPKVWLLDTLKSARNSMATNRESGTS